MKSGGSSRIEGSSPQANELIPTEARERSRRRTSAKEGSTRREFLIGSAALVAGCATRARTIEGGIVGPSRDVGHLLRDGNLPAPTAVRDVPVVVVGGGIAGLSAAWKLAKCGVDCEVLELEPEVGGNSRWGENRVSPYPWAAHYVPVPTASSRAVRELFRELGVMEGDRCREEYLCHAPHERIFMYGRWVDGLFPRVGMTADDAAQVERFNARLAEFRAARVFAIPLELSTADPSLDALTMRAWMEREGFTSERLRWYVDYCCRDDYGCSIDTTSAWAALHYFCAREVDDPEVLTWPEGNGWIVKRLREKLAGRLRTNALVYRATREGEVDVLDTRTRESTRLRAKHVVFALPRFIARHVIPGYAPPEGFTYGPWMVANVTVDRLPDEACWDNVIWKSPSLGYVVATHQALRAHVGPSVLTYYRPFAEMDPSAARRAMFTRTWESWRDEIVAELSRAHRGIASLVRSIDVMLWAHAMIRPTPGFITGAARRESHAPLGRVRFAHSDMSGISIFEEAQYWGVRAAEGILAEMGRPFESSL